MEIPETNETNKRKMSQNMVSVRIQHAHTNLRVPSPPQHTPTNWQDANDILLAPEEPGRKRGKRNSKKGTKRRARACKPTWMDLQAHSNHATTTHSEHHGNPISTRSKHRKNTCVETDRQNNQNKGNRQNKTTHTRTPQVGTVCQNSTFVHPAN